MNRKHYLFFKKYGHYPDDEELMDLGDDGDGNVYFEGEFLGVI